MLKCIKENLPYFLAIVVLLFCGFVWMFWPYDVTELVDSNGRILRIIE